MDNKDKTTIEKKKEEPKKPKVEIPKIEMVEAEAPSIANSVELSDIKIYSSESSMEELIGYAAWLLANKDIQDYLDVTKFKRQLKETPSYLE